jgi:Domain of unknown function (DUF4180)
MQNESASLPIKTNSYDLHGVRIFEYAAEGPALQSEQDATAVLGDAMAQGAELVLLPAGKLSASFFQLRTGLAGAIVQKFVNYRMRLAIVGTISPQALESTALRAYILECNRGKSVWFLDNLDDLIKRLQRPVPSSGGPN